MPETDLGVASVDWGITARPAAGESLHGEARCSVWRKRIADMTRTAPRQSKVEQFRLAAATRNRAQPIV